MYRASSFGLPGWIALAPQGDTALAVHVQSRPGQPPQVSWAWQGDWREPTLRLRALRRQYALHRHRTVLVLPHGHYQVLALDAPEVPPSEWRDALRWQLPELVDFPIEDAALDILAIPASAAIRRRASVLVVAAPHAQVMPWAHLGLQVGLPWTAIDIPDTGLRNIAALSAPPGRGSALLHVQGPHSTLVVIADGELLLSRHIDVGLTQLTDHHNPHGQQTAYERISLELQRTLDNVERQFDQVTLAQLQVSPGAMLEPFMAYVRDLVYVPVTALELSALMDLRAVPELQNPDQLAQFLPVLGAAMRPDTATATADHPPLMAEAAA